MRNSNVVPRSETALKENSTTRSQEDQLQTVNSELESLKANLENIVELTETAQKTAKPKRVFRNVRKRHTKSQQRPDGMVFTSCEDLKLEETKRDKLLHTPYEPTYPRHIRNVTLL